jgi:hypothetical protein
MATDLYQSGLLDKLAVGEMKCVEFHITSHLSLVLIVSRTDERELSYQLALIRY